MTNGGGNPYVIIFLSTVFGALITYFFKTIFQNKTARREAKELVKEGFEVHTKIHHKNSYSDAIDISRMNTDEKISEYRKEVDYKIKQEHDRIIEVADDIKTIKSSVDGININIAGINGILQLRHNQKGGNPQ